MRIGVGAAALLIVLEAYAQTATKPEFIVADVKVNKLDENSTAEFLPSGQMNLRAVTMKTLIGIGWKESRVLPEVSGMSILLTPVSGMFSSNSSNYLKGGPAWLDTDRFDVIAKAPPGTPTDTVRLMVQTVLEDRFHLAVHVEQKTMKVYVMTVAKGGHKLNAAAAGSERAGTGQPTCARSISADNVYHRECKNMTMAELAGQLPSFAPRFFEGRPVVDATGLAGAWDFRVDWTPMNGGLNGLGQPDGGESLNNDTGTTIFRTMEKNLGLKLDLKEQTMPIVVIDQVDRVPTEN